MCGERGHQWSTHRHTDSVSAQSADSSQACLELLWNSSQLFALHSSPLLFHSPLYSSLQRNQCNSHIGSLTNTSALQTKRLRPPSSSRWHNHTSIPATVLSAHTHIPQHSHSDAQVQGMKAYQCRPMLRMQRLCISLLSGLVSRSAAMSDVLTRCMHGWR